MARKPRVFTWSDGLHAYTVATTGKARALEAWDVARDLFKDGEAQEIFDGPDHAAALKKPGRSIRTPAAKALEAVSRAPPSH